MTSIASVSIIGILILIVLFTLLVLIWFGHQFGYKVLDLFSLVKSEHGVIAEKEYVPSRTKIVNRTIIRTHDEFSSTKYDIPQEIQIPEKYILHIKLNEEIIVTPITQKTYRALEQGDSVLVSYAQGRFSKKIYFKKLRRS